MVSFAPNGSWQMLAIARFPKKSFTGVQVAGEAEISVVFHKPPSIPPTHTVWFDASERSTQIALIRPLVTPPPARVLLLLGPTASELGPRSDQLSAEIPLGVFGLNFLLAIR